MTNLPCIHRGEVLEQIECTTCGQRRRQVDVYACQKFERCTLRKIKAGEDDRPQDCLTCAERDDGEGGRALVKPRKLILKTHLSPGDILTLTAAVETLAKRHRRRYQVDVRTSCPAIWEHNPHLTPLDPEAEDVETIEVHYPSVHHSNRAPVCFLAGYADYLAKKLQRPMPLATNRPHLYLSDQEKSWINQVHEHVGRRVPFWLVNAGTKSDFTAKQWPIEFYQQVVDHFAGRMLFVQIGAAEHNHEPLRGVLDLVGQTDHRQLIRLAYHASGGLGPVTYLQHLCAAWEKPYVCLLGGREPVTWVQNYPRQHTLHTIGALDCCRNGACWKSRVVPLGDGDEKDKSLCELPVTTLARPVGQCMAMIRPEEVCAAIERAGSAR